MAENADLMAAENLPSSLEWIPESRMLAKAKKGPKLAKIGLASMEKLGTIEKRQNPDNGETEWRITPRGIKAGLSFKNV
jgi:hypothetical protein